MEDKEEVDYQAAEDIIRIPKKEDDKSPRLIVYLDSASLETVKMGNDFQLLNCDDHINIMKKRKRDIGEARPDIVHQVK